jgi:hypothetical protein
MNSLGISLDTPFKLLPYVILFFNSGTERGKHWPRVSYLPIDLCGNSLWSSFDTLI